MGLTTPPLTVSLRPYRRRRLGGHETLPLSVGLVPPGEGGTRPRRRDHYLKCPGVT